MNYQSIRNFIVGCLILWASCNSPLSERQTTNNVGSESITTISVNKSIIENDIDNRLRAEVVAEDLYF